MIPSAIVRFNTDRPRSMEKVILKPGDTVQHTTLGEGTVTVADEEFCTVRFETREAMFRLPDAFEDGFLTSEDAQIIEDEDDYEEEEEVEVEEDDSSQKATRIMPAKPQEHKKGNSVMAIILAIIMGIIFVPIGIHLIKTGSEYDESFFYIIGFIFCCAPIVGFLFGSIGSGSSSSSGGSIIHYDHSEDYGTSTSFLGNKKNESSISDDERIRREIYAQQDENLSILEDMIQMHSANPDADLEEHYGWDHKIDYDQDGGDDAW